jgi:hypothetical protein
MTPIEERGLTPLQYTLGVLCDETAPPERRAEIAKVAAPYVRPIVLTVIKMQLEETAKR